MQHSTGATGDSGRSSTSRSPQMSGSAPSSAGSAQNGAKNRNGARYTRATWTGSGTPACSRNGGGRVSEGTGFALRNGGSFVSLLKPGRSAADNGSALPYAPNLV